MEFRLLGAALLGVAAVYATLWVEARRSTADDGAGKLWDAALGSILAGVAVGRLTAMVTDGVNPLTHPGDILIVRGGVDTVGATIGALAGLGLLARRDLWRIADGLAAAALAGLAGWHAGCWVRESCAGTPTDLPWAVTTPGGAIGRHPVELYAAVFLAAGAIALAIWKRRSPAHGAPAAAAGALAALARLATEPMRLTIGASPWPWYAAAFVVGTLAVAWRLRRGAAGRSADGDQGVESFPEH